MKRKLIYIATALVLGAALWTVLKPQVAHQPNSRSVAQAANDCLQIQNAIRAFQNEYGVYPVQGENEGPHRLDESTAVLDLLMARDTLEGRSSDLGKLVFLDPSTFGRTLSPNGLQDDFSRLNDPWDQPYEVYMDADGDGQAAIPDIYESKFDRPRLIKRPVFVHSAGPDKNFKTIVDNVTSWD